MLQSFPGRLATAWRRRSTRAEYWLSLVALASVHVILGSTLRSPAIVSLVDLPFWLLIAARRLHDFEAHAVWALIPLATGFALGFLQGFLAAFGSAALIAAPDQNTIVALVATTSCVAIGLWPGAKSENRYGPAANALPVQDAF